MRRPPTGAAAGRATACSPLWRAPDARSLARREWGGEHVVFDAATAATHLLDAAGGEVLARLLESPVPLSEPELLRRLGDAADTAADLPALRTVLRDLERIGLARREAP